MIENNPLSPQTNEDWERETMISRCNRAVERAISDCETTSFLIAVSCAISSYYCMRNFQDGGWRLLGVFPLFWMVLSGNVCYKIAKEIILQRLRKRWGYPQKSSSAEWEREAAKQFDDALASCILTCYKRPIHIILRTIVIASVLASVLYGAFVYLDPPDHPDRLFLVFAAWLLLNWYYRDND
ncbi:MAG: hypothetical protein WC340_11110 [Kiritimatiellia bacterium]